MDLTVSVQERGGCRSRENLEGLPFPPLPFPVAVKYLLGFLGDVVIDELGCLTEEGG